MSKAPHWALIDNLKGLGCLLIVVHHLAFYGPMSDYAQDLIPEVIDWLYEYGRMAIAVFLVIGGFLTGRVISSPNLFVTKGLSDYLWHKYIRLLSPYVFALVLAIVCTFTATYWFDHPSLSHSPSAQQFLMHLLLLQNILEIEPLSAGIWYISIDFQLFAVTLIMAFLVERISPITWTAQRTKRLTLWFTTLLTLSAAFIFNRFPELDNYFIYFYGAYGIGILSYFIAQSKHMRAWLVLLTGLVLLSLLINFRERLLIALCVGTLLCWAQKYQKMNHPMFQNWLAQIGKMSYSVFLIHYPVSLLISAAWMKLFPLDPFIQLLGMFTSILASIAAGFIFYQLVEQKLHGKSLKA